MCVMNVNCPHFLIFQVQITEVLNMNELMEIDKNINEKLIPSLEKFEKDKKIIQKNSVFFV